jgi:hypothetical protein
MRPYGTVVEILGKTLLLVKLDQAVSVDDDLKVFAEVATPALAEKHKLPHIYIPKGEIRIVAKQTEEYYLAETFREIVESMKVVEKPSSFLTGIWGSETVREKVYGPPSAALSSPTTVIQFPAQVLVGDCVGKD